MTTAHDWELRCDETGTEYWHCLRCGTDTSKDSDEYIPCKREPVMSEEFNMVGDMYHHFKLISKPVSESTVPRLIDNDMMNFRLKALHEELHELTEAYEKDDLAGIADALIDMSVFIMGTAQLHGLPWADLFYEVHEANMKKIVGKGKKIRGIGQPDLIKPEGWKAPNIVRVLREHGYRDW